MLMITYCFRAGIIVLGMIKLNTIFVRSRVEFSLSVEPKLSLQADIDFSLKTKLCMRLSQPDSLFR